MTVTRMQNLPPEDGWAAEEGIDWRRYVVVLASWWREIVVITMATALLAGLAVFAVNRLGGLKYKAWADVAIVRTTSELTLDPRFTTTSDTDVRYIATNASAWRNGLIGLAEGPAIAEQVVGQLGDLLDARHRIPANLAKDVEASLVSGSGRAGDSDLIRITAAADTPGKAARIAAAWAETYVRQVNQIYGQAPDELLASIKAEQARANADYDKAQTALEEFIADNRSDELSRQIVEKERVINQIDQARAVLTATYFQTERENRTERFVRWLQVTRALDQARTLRDQVTAGSPASTGGGALVADLLKLQALTQMLDEGSNPAAASQSGSGSLQVQVDTPLQIQLDANSASSPGELIADIDGLIQALEKRRGELEQQIAASSEQLLSSDMYSVLAQSAQSGSSLAQSMRARPAAEPDTELASTIPTATVSSELLTSTVRDLEEEVRGLKAELEKEGARGKQLTRERDLTWDTLKTVSSKVAELALARAAAGSEVRLAAPAVPPAKPEGSGAVKAVVDGGMLGLLVGVIIALVANAFGIPPFFSRRQVKA